MSKGVTEDPKLIRLAFFWGRIKLTIQDGKKYRSFLRSLYILPVIITGDIIATLIDIIWETLGEDTSHVSAAALAVCTAMGSLCFAFGRSMDEKNKDYRSRLTIAGSYFIVAAIFMVMLTVSRYAGMRQNQFLIKSSMSHLARIHRSALYVSISAIYYFGYFFAFIGATHLSFTIADFHWEFMADPLRLVFGVPEDKTAISKPVAHVDE